MSKKKAFLLRTDPALLNALQQWADIELRSLNAQIEFLLRRALNEAKRRRSAGAQPDLFDADDLLEDDS